MGGLKDIERAKCTIFKPTYCRASFQKAKPIYCKIKLSSEVNVNSRMLKKKEIG